MLALFTMWYACLNFKSSWVFQPCYLYTKDILQDGILKAYELTGLDRGIP